MATVIPILVFLVTCVLTQVVNGRPTFAPYNQYTDTDRFHYGYHQEYRYEDPYHLFSHRNQHDHGDYGYVPSSTIVKDTQPYNRYPEARPASSQSPYHHPRSIGEHFVFLLSGEKVSRQIYDSCTGCYTSGSSLVITTTKGDIILASTYPQFLAITDGRPNDTVKLEDGSVLTAGLYKSIINDHLTKYGIPAKASNYTEKHEPSQPELEEWKNVEPIVILPSGERLSYPVYSSILESCEKKIPVTVTTIHGDVVPVSTYTEILLVTQGRPQDIIQLPCGEKVTAATYRAVVNAHAEKTATLEYPPKHLSTVKHGHQSTTIPPAPETKPYPETTLASRKVDVVVLPSGEQIPYRQYECIVDSNTNKKALRIYTPEGQYVARGLPEILLVTQRRPHDLVEIDNGELVPVRIYSEVVDAYSKNQIIFVHPSRHHSREDTNRHHKNIEKIEPVVILPNGEEMPHYVYDAIIKNHVTYAPMTVIKSSGETHTVNTLPQLVLWTQGDLDDVVQLQDGVVVTAEMYRSAVYAHVNNAAVLKYPNGQVISHDPHRYQPHAAPPQSKAPEDVISPILVKPTILPLRSGDPAIVLPSGELVPRGVYESIMSSFFHDKPLKVITAEGKIKVVDSLSDLLLTTHGRLGDVVQLENGVTISAGTYRGVINAYQQNEVFVRTPSGETVHLPKETRKAPHDSSVAKPDEKHPSDQETYRTEADSSKPQPTEQPTTAEYPVIEDSERPKAGAIVILPSQKRIPYHVYDSIVDSYMKRRPLKVAFSDGNLVSVYPLTELLLITQNCPDELVWLENGEVTTARIYREVVIAHLQDEAIVQYPSGCIEPLSCKTSEKPETPSKKPEEKYEEPQPNECPTEPGVAVDQKYTPPTCPPETPDCDGNTEPPVTESQEYPAEPVGVLTIDKYGNIHLVNVEGNENIKYDKEGDVETVTVTEPTENCPTNKPETCYEESPQYPGVKTSETPPDCESTSPNLQECPEAENPTPCPEEVTTVDPVYTALIDPPYKTQPTKVYEEVPPYNPPYVPKPYVHPPMPEKHETYDKIQPSEELPASYVPEEPAPSQSQPTAVPDGDGSYLSSSLGTSGPSGPIPADKPYSDYQPESADNGELPPATATPSISIPSPPYTTPTAAYEPPPPASGDTHDDAPTTYYGTEITPVEQYDKPEETGTYDDSQDRPETETITEDLSPPSTQIIPPPTAPEDMTPEQPETVNEYPNEEEGYVIVPPETAETYETSEVPTETKETDEEAPTDNVQDGETCPAVTPNEERDPTETETTYEPPTDEVQDDETGPEVTPNEEHDPTETEQTGEEPHTEDVQDGETYLAVTPNEEDPTETETTYEEPSKDEVPDEETYPAVTPNKEQDPTETETTYEEPCKDEVPNEETYPAVTPNKEQDPTETETTYEEPSKDEVPDEETCSEMTPNEEQDPTETEPTYEEPCKDEVPNEETYPAVTPNKEQDPTETDTTYEEPSKDEVPDEETYPAVTPNEEEDPTETETTYEEPSKDEVPNEETCSEITPNEEQDPTETEPTYEEPCKDEVPDEESYPATIPNEQSVPPEPQHSKPNQESPEPPVTEGTVSDECQVETPREEIPVPPTKGVQEEGPYPPKENATVATDHESGQNQDHSDRKKISIIIVEPSQVPSHYHSDYSIHTHYRQPARHTQYYAAGIPYPIIPYFDSYYPAENRHVQRSPKKPNASKKRSQKKKKPREDLKILEDIPEVRPSYTPVYDDNNELLYFLRSDLLSKGGKTMPRSESEGSVHSHDEHQPHVTPKYPHKIVHDDEGNMYVLPINPDGTLGVAVDYDPLNIANAKKTVDANPTAFTFSGTEEYLPPSHDPDYIIVRSPEGYIHYVPRHIAPGREITLSSGDKVIVPVFPSRWVEPSVQYHAFTTPEGIVYDVPYGRGHGADTVESSVISIERFETPDGEKYNVPVESKKRSDGSVTTTVEYDARDKTKYKTIVDVFGDIYCVPVTGTTIHQVPKSKTYKTIIDADGNEYHVPENQQISQAYVTIVDVDGNIYEIPATTKPYDNIRRAKYRHQPPEPATKHVSTDDYISQPSDHGTGSTEDSNYDYSPSVKIIHTSAHYEPTSHHHATVHQPNPSPSHDHVYPERVYIGHNTHSYETSPKTVYAQENLHHTYYPSTDYHHPLVYNYRPA